MEHDFARREGVALVTGGSGAIGAATTRMLAARGSRVVFTYLGNLPGSQINYGGLGQITGLVQGPGCDPMKHRLLRRV